MSFKTNRVTLKVGDILVQIADNCESVSLIFVSIQRRIEIRGPRECTRLQSKTLEVVGSIPSG